MYNIVPNKKQKLSLAGKYSRYLSEWPKPTDKLRNKYNLFDDLNSIDKVMMKAAKRDLPNSERAGLLTNNPEEVDKEIFMSKDRGRNAI